MWEIESVMCPLLLSEVCKSLSSLCRRLVLVAE
jgi:hypothetical protein